MATVIPQKIPGSTATIWKGLFLGAMKLPTYKPSLAQLVATEAAVAGMRKNIIDYPSRLLSSYSLVAHNIAQIKEHKNANQVLPLYEPQAIQYKAEISELVTERESLSQAITDLIQEKDELFQAIVKARTEYKTVTSQVDLDLTKFDKKRRSYLDQMDALNRNEENLQRKIDLLADTSEKAAKALVGESYQPGPVPPRELR